MGSEEHHLIVDIGNSFIKLAIFGNSELLFNKSYSRLLVSDLKEVYQSYSVTHAIYANVRKKEPRFVQHLAKKFHLIEMKPGVDLPIKNLYKTPKTLGMDRLAGVMGAQAMYPGKNVLVIDLGTCIKYDFIDAKGCYHGGNIAPGLSMRLSSMHEMTGKLPLVAAKFNKEVLGKSTSEAMQNGAVWGIKLEIEGFIKTLTEKWGDITIILSGGDSNYFGEIIESKIFVCPDLILIGLNQTLNHLK